LKAQLTLDTLRFEDKIKDIKAQLKTDLPQERRVALRVDLADTKRELTEARRQLNNLANT